jgi:two-component system nitrate/nitrite response regulator NarL
MASSLLAEGLQRHSRLRVVTCALRGAELSSAIDQYAPDVALISAQSDAGAPDGYEAISGIHQQHPAARVVFLLDRSDREAVVEAFRVGASGVFCRSTYAPKLLRRCVESVARGQIWANSKELGYLLDDYRNAAPQRVVSSDGIAMLTPREQDVYHLVSDGLMNREIAGQLGLSERTVKNYIFHVFDKLGISTRVELVLHATAHGQGKSQAANASPSESSAQSSFQG